MQNVQIGGLKIRTVWVRVPVGAQRACWVERFRRGATKRSQALLVVIATRCYANASNCGGIQYTFQRRFGAVLCKGIAVAPEGVDELSVLGGAARE